MNRFLLRLRYALAVLAVGGFSSTLFADVITVDDISSIDTNTIGSGNGTLDLRLLTFSGSEIQNAASGFDFDNGNNDLPQGSGADISFFDESYFTSAGELKDFYELNFPDGIGGSTIDELVVFLDLNETGATAQANNLLTRLDIFLNPDSVNGGLDPVANDLTSNQQAGIDQISTGGALIANLDSPVNLPVLFQGAGFADYAIFTGINVFDLDDSDTLLFDISFENLNNGAEEIFLSGEFAGLDIVQVPEPGSFSIVGLLGLALVARRSRRDKSK